ncbi:hypothetical protein JTE90_014524 [Oedothorax gibbosus]|uniref:RRM domain-containing protein n=1 Tax=Oedothorax gibbosus TaxID=931172 RepID=A0AAV6UZB5_9ARAC|nr:hypothetical protein JTE90_014524 [Oedothorax gibbosus]
MFQHILFPFFILVTDYAGKESQATFKGFNISSTSRDGTRRTPLSLVRGQRCRCFGLSGEKRITRVSRLDCRSHSAIEEVPNVESLQVRTLFVSGLPMDAKPRELYLLFRAYKGYEGSLLKVTSKNGKTSSPVGFVTFTTRAGAEAAKLDLQQGVRFDPDLPQTIRLEFAKSNTKVSKPKQPSPPAAPQHPGLLHPITGQMGTLLPAVPDGWSHHPLSYTEVPVSTALHSAAIVHPALHAQLPPPLHPIPHAVMHHPPPPQMAPPHFHSTAPPNSTPPPQQSPQCSTLFVANLGHFVQEQELKDIYGSFPGFCRLRMHNKAPGPLTYVEYKLSE